MIKIIKVDQRFLFELGGISTTTGFRISFPETSPRVAQRRPSKMRERAKARIQAARTSL